MSEGWHHGAIPPHRHLERNPGKYVAIDMKTGEVVLLVAETPQELEAEIRARRLRNVGAMRAPAADEPLFVAGR
ncbi:MAG TPA: hypothetical protein VK988_08300 [Acidimicrobiales bacterium]|nr:hypothetical protein [Acidimicrobiales bacterium]